MQLRAQRSHLPENAGHLALGPHERSQGCGRRAAQDRLGLVGPQVWQPAARQHLNTSLFFHPHPPLPSSGNALGTELLSPGNYEGEIKKHSLASCRLAGGILHPPALCGCPGPACAWVLGHIKPLQVSGSLAAATGPLLDRDSRRVCQPFTHRTWCQERKLLLGRRAARTTEPGAEAAGPVLGRGGEG